MVEGGGGPAFPVVFFDGEREINIGNVQINPALEYKPFQLMLSQKIGISPNQISIYLVDRKKNPTLPFTEDRRRIPITGKVNFGLICRQKDCCFFVVLKRSRKSRNRRERTTNGVEFSDFIPENEFSPPPVHPVPENLILLRRNQPAPFYDQITQSELASLNDRLQSLRFQRENYELAMGKGDLNSRNFGSGYSVHPSPSPSPSPSPRLNLNMVSFPEINPYLGAPSTMTMMMKNDSRKPFCEDCLNEKNNGGTPSFHPCVRDAVITSFRTLFGPINRPNKILRW